MHICGCRQPYLIELGDHDYVLDPCKGCGELVGIRVGPNEEFWQSVCLRCGTEQLWQPDRRRDVVVICYDCLCSGRAAIDHETEVGVIELPFTARGLVNFGRSRIAASHGLSTTVLERYDDGSERIGVALPPDLLNEMHRTPRYLTLQREYWPYHCGGFMTFLGRWHHQDFERQAPSGLQWFGEHMDPDEPWEDMWYWLSDDDSVAWSYVHQCPKCGRHRVFVDSD